MSVVVNTAIRLRLLPDLLDEGGEARAALEMPPAAPGRRAVVMVFSSIAAAVAAKRGLEEPPAQAGEGAG